MPETRPLSSLPTSNFDDPPANDASTPYPDRHTRLRRALRNTNDLAHEVTRDGRSAYSPAVDSHRNTSIGMLRRTRRRLRSTSQSERPADSTADEPLEGGRSNKRRRLNDDSPPVETRSIKYGHFGQVEAGRLRMEIVSNDGGEHQDPRNPGIFLGADNMLKLDKSVFCSERTSAGIVMRHVDGTPFSLEKLHVVGPEHGFTAPVREGVVYVAMDIKHLRKYQDPPYYARRSVVHEQPYNRYRGIRASPEQLSLADALRDPEIASAANRSISPFPRDDPEHPADEEPYYGANYLGRIDPETHCDIPSPGEIQQSSFEDGAPFTLVSDEDSGPEDTSPQEVLDYRLQRLRRMRLNHDTDDWDSSGPTWSYSRADGTVVHRGVLGGTSQRSFPNNMIEALLARARPYLSPSPPPPDPPLQARMKRTKAPQPAADDLNVRAARFSIKRGKSRVTVKFDPPVSGCYMLLKLWAGRSNVDVQSVIAKGYAGPRFFPAIEMT